MRARLPSVPRGVLALVVVVGAALGYRWLRHDDGSARPGRHLTAPTASATPTTPHAASGAPSPPATAADVRPADATPLATAAVARPSDRSPSPRPTPPVFDLAQIARAPQAKPPVDDADRFPTTDRFTQEDRRHPERYFELAERMPELNRPEERRDTLEYFLAYRRTLQRDLDASRDAGERREILATIARYDAAITRLRGLIDRPESTPNARARHD